MSLAKEFLSGQKHRVTITPLTMGRLKVERWLTISNSAHDKYLHNNFGKDVDLEDQDLTIKIFGGYGLLDGADNLDEALGDAAKDTLAGAYTHRAYKDCRLVHEECAPTKEAYQLYQVYEHLTSEWELEVADQTVTTESGLIDLTRMQVATPSTPLPELIVGTTTLVLNEGDDDEVTLYLASKLDASDDRRGRVTTKWEEAGKLSQSEPIVGQDNLRQITAVWRGIVGDAPDGYVAASSRSDNVSGWPTTAISYYKSDDLSSSYVYSDTESFHIPGTVSYATQEMATNIENFMLDIYGPEYVTCPATITVTYSTSATPDTSGVYRAPIARAILSGMGLSYAGISSSSTYSNHFALNAGVEIVAPLAFPSEIKMMQGRQLYAGRSAFILISGKGTDPSGTTVIKSIDNKPVFRLLDGTQYYRKVVTQIHVPERR